MEGLEHLKKKLPFAFKDVGSGGSCKEDEFGGIDEDSHAHLGDIDFLGAECELVRDAVCGVTAELEGFFVQEPKTCEAGFKFIEVLVDVVLRGDAGTNFFAAKGDVLTEACTHPKVRRLARINDPWSYKGMNRLILPCIGQFNREMTNENTHLEPPQRAEW